MEEVYSEINRSKRRGTPSSLGVFSIALDSGACRIDEQAGKNGTVIVRFNCVS